MAGNLDVKHKKIMENLLLLSSFRGKDSTGVASVDKRDEEVIITKNVGNPYDFLDYKPWDKISAFNQKVMIGHTRHTTSGKINKMNAHPFTEEHITGVHNGTLDWGWKNKLKDGDYFDVDSNAIIHNLSLAPPTEVIPTLQGAYALVWWNAKESTLNFIRNKERSLHFCMNEAKDVVFWASEVWMLNMLRSQHGGFTKMNTDKDGYCFFEVPVDTLRTLKIDPKDKNTPIKVVVEKKLEGAKKPAPVNNNKSGGFSNRSEWNWGGNPNYGTGKKPERTVVTLVEDPFDWEDDLPFELKPETKGPTKDATTTTTTSGKTSKTKGSSKLLSLKDSRTQTSSLSLVVNNKDADSNSSKSSQLPSSSDKQILNSKGDEICFEEFADLTHGGFCAFCQNQLDENTAKTDITKWIDQESFLCAECCDVQDYYANIYG